jgi:hypothetical protein
MTITDNLPAVRNAANLPAINVTSTEVSVLRASDRFRAALAGAEQGGQHRLRNPWQVPSRITGGVAATTFVTAGFVAKFTPEHIPTASVGTVAALALFLGALGMHGRFARNAAVTSLDQFKPVTTP